MPELTVITIFVVVACFLVARSRIALERARLVGELWKICALAQEREMELQLDTLGAEDDAALAAIQDQLDDAFDEGLAARGKLEDMGENDA